MLGRDRKFVSQIENKRRSVKARKEALGQMEKPSVAWMTKLAADPNTPPKLAETLNSRIQVERDKQSALREAGANTRHKRTSTDRFLMKEYLRLRSKYPDEHIPVPILSDGRPFSGQAEAADGE